MKTVSLSGTLACRLALPRVHSEETPEVKEGERASCSLSDVEQIRRGGRGGGGRQLLPQVKAMNVGEVSQNREIKIRPSESPSRTGNRRLIGASERDALFDAPRGNQWI